MAKLFRVLVVAGLSFVTVMGHGQAPAAVVAPAPALAPVDTAKEIAAMQAKLDDWPQMGRYRVDNAALAPAAPGEERVVFYGDSITDGWGRGVGRGDFFPGKPYVNRGISGQTTPQMVVRFRQDVIDLHPAAVVILAGTNDVAGNTGPMTPAADYPWKHGLTPAPKIKALNDWLKGYCVTHSVTYLDYYSALVGDDGGMKSGLSFDGVHPNAAGYAIMGPLAQAAIDKTLG